MRKADALIIAVFVLLVLWLSILTFTSPYPNGTDVWFHVLVARAWYKGLNGMISPVVMDINNIPYPPLFHLLLIPFAGNLDNALFVAKVLQLVFYPVGVLAWALLVRKYTSSKVALTFALAITGTYFSFSQMQTKPESLTLLILPLVIYAFMEKKNLFFIGLSACLFYIYSPYSLFLIIGLVAYSLWVNFKGNIRNFLSITALSAPMLLYQVAFINEKFWSRWVTQGDRGLIRETLEFINYPAWFLINGFGINIISFILVPYTFLKWKEQSQFTKVMLVTLIGMIFVFPIWLQRTFSLIIIPCCYITALYIQRLRNKPAKAILLVALVIQAVVFTLNPVWWMSPINWLERYW